MKSAIMVLVVLLSLFQFGAIACKCGEKESVKKEIKKSDAVFTGLVVAEETFTVRDTILGTDNVVTNLFRKVKLKANALYKGELQTDTIEVITGVGGGDCGFGFEIGKVYVVYADYKTQFSPLGNSTARYLFTHVCKRTKAMDQAEVNEIQKFRKPIKT